MSLFPLAFTVAVLAMLWTYVSPLIGLLTWPAFVGWAIYFIAGGEARSIVKGGAPLLLGILLAWCAVQVGSGFEAFGIPLAVGVIAFAMVMLANVGLFALIPAQFIGAAVFFGTGADLPATLISMALGLALGLLSTTISGLATRSKAH